MCVCVWSTNSTWWNEMLTKSLPCLLTVTEMLRSLICLLHGCSTSLHLRELICNSEYFVGVWGHSCMSMLWTRMYMLWVQSLIQHRMAHTCKSSSWEVGIGGSRVQNQASLNYMRIHLKKTSLFGTSVGRLQISSSGILLSREKR